MTTAYLFGITAALIAVLISSLSAVGGVVALVTLTIGGVWFFGRMDKLLGDYS